MAVIDGKILAAGTLDEVRGWATNQEVEIDRRFENAVIVPGFIEAHMHPQITGVLWQGVYVGRFDRTSPEGIPNKGLETKQAVLERLKEAAAKLPADGRWMLAWGYQPEFYDNSPLTRADLDPISNGHPIFIENLSMHIYYANSKAFEIAGIGRQHHHSRHHQEGRQADRRNRRDRGGPRPSSPSCRRSTPRCSPRPPGT